MFQKSEAFDDARPSPALVCYFENVDLEHISGFGATDEDGTGERVDLAAINSKILWQRHLWMNLCAARVNTFEMNCVTGFDGEPGRKSAVPPGMCRPGRKIVFGHGPPRFRQSFGVRRVHCEATRRP